MPLVDEVPLLSAKLQATFAMVPLPPTLVALAQAGTQRVDVVCPGFTGDCLETLEEINMEAREAFLHAGGKSFGYIPCLNDDPAGMIVKCAEADALRSAFPTMLGGCYTEEEMPVPADQHNQPQENMRRRVQRAKPIKTINATHTNPVSSVPGQPEAAPAVGDVSSSREPAEQHLDESPNHRSPADRRTHDEGPAALYPAGSGDTPRASEGSDHQGVEQDQELGFPGKDELATLAETLKCPPDQCLDWAESALALLEDGVIDDPCVYLGTKPWDKKPPKSKSGSKIKPAKEISEDEIPF